MITARGTLVQAQALTSALDSEEGYPNPATMTERYAAIEQDGNDYVVVLPDSDDKRAKKAHGKIEKGDTRKGIK